MADPDPGILAGLPDLDGPRRTRETYPVVEAAPGRIVEHRASGLVGFVVRARTGVVLLLLWLAGALFASPVAGVLQALLVAIWAEWRATHPREFQRAKDDLAEKVEEVTTDAPGDPESTPKSLS